MNSVIVFFIIFTMYILTIGVFNNKIAKYNIIGLSLLLINENNFISIFIITCSIIIFFIADIDLETTVIINIAIIGLLILIKSTTLIIMYISLEMIALSFYILAGRERHGVKSTEAGLKYFILGALGSGILLLGISLVYAQTGNTEITSLTGMNVNLILVGLLFKIGAAPFHVWVPDVYEGSPTIITTFFAVVPKLAYLSIIMQLKINSLLLIIGILSIAVGAIGAINQTIIKRLLAFSAIGHIGFMLLGIGIGSYTSYLATIVYMIIYVIMTVQTFTIILATNKNKIIELSGFSRQNIILSSSFGIGLMSIAGVPPLVGFYNKYLILMSVIEANEIIYAIIAVLLSVIAGFYYLRIIQYMYFSDQPVITTVNKYTITSNQGIILGLTTYIILTLMSYPSLIIDLTLPNLY